MDRMENEYIKLGLSYVNMGSLSAIEYESKKTDYSIINDEKVGESMFTFRVHLITGKSFEVVIKESEMDVLKDLNVLSKLKELKNE